MFTQSDLAPRRFLTEDEVAEMLRLSNRTLQGWRVDGRGPRYLKLGAGVRCRIVYAESEVDAFVKANTFQATCETTARERKPTAKPKAKAAR